MILTTIIIIPGEWSDAESQAEQAREFYENGDLETAMKAAEIRD